MLAEAVVELAIAGPIYACPLNNVQKRRPQTPVLGFSLFSPTYVRPQN
jgi:hypothetical protein